MNNLIYIVIKHSLVIGLISLSSICSGKTLEKINDQSHLLKQVNEINIDSLSINPETKSVQLIDENEKERIIYEVMNEGRKEFLNWFNLQFAVILFFVSIGLPAIIYLIIEKILTGKLNAKLDELEKARMAKLDELEKARMVLIESTKNLDIDLEKRKTTIEKLILLESELERDRIIRKAEIDSMEVKLKQDQDKLKDSYNDLKISIDDNSNYFMNANAVTTRWLEAIDSNYESANSVINELIDDFENPGNDIDKKLEIINLLAHFECNEQNS